MGVDVPGGQLDVIIALHDVHVELPLRWCQEDALVDFELKKPSHCSVER